MRKADSVSRVNEGQGGIKGNVAHFTGGRGRGAGVDGFRLLAAAASCFTGGAPPTGGVPLRCCCCCCAAAGRRGSWGRALGCPPGGTLGGRGGAAAGLESPCATTKGKIMPRNRRVS